MASFFSHPAYTVALKYSSSRPVSKKLFYLCLILTCLPDADVIAFKFGIPYESQWGHRGFTHSIIFALAMGFFCQLFSDAIGETKKRVFWWTFTSTLSHVFMDALTNGGLGVAVLWPFSHARFFFPWRPVQVSPIGVGGFISMRGVVVVLNEILWLWMPSILFILCMKWRRRNKT